MKLRKAKTEQEGARKSELGANGKSKVGVAQRCIKSKGNDKTPVEKQKSVVEKKGHGKGRRNSQHDRVSTDSGEAEGNAGGSHPDSS